MGVGWGGLCVVYSTVYQSFEWPYFYLDRFLLDEAKLWLSDKDFMEIRLDKGGWVGTQTCQLLHFEVYIVFSIK